MSELRMFVNGQAMRGGSLNDALDDAAFLGRVRTAPRYEFHSVRDEFPGLAITRGDAGHSIEGELYGVSYRVLRDQLLPREPDELELGLIELEDGTGSLSMLMRPGAVDLPGVVDISRHGGWVRYLNESAGS